MKDKFWSRPGAAKRIDGSAEEFFRPCWFVKCFYFERESMIKEYNTKSFIYGIPGIILQIASFGLVMSAVSSFIYGLPGIIFQIAPYSLLMSAVNSGTVTERPGYVLFLRMLMLAGTILLLVGFAYALKAKGRNPWWCLLAFIGIFGLFSIACFRDLAVTEEDEAKKQMAATGRMSKMAVTSLVLAILSIITLCYSAIPGLIFGIIALIRIKKKPQELRGAKVAIWGIVLSVIFVICLRTNLII